MPGAGEAEGLHRGGEGQGSTRVGAARWRALAGPALLEVGVDPGRERVDARVQAGAEGVDPATSPPNHSPSFDVNEAVLPVGVKAHVLTALRFLERS